MAATMVPLYSARIEDLNPGDVVIIECAGCDHVAMLTADHLTRLGARPERRVLDLASRVCCRSCDARGRASVSIKWAKPAAG